jgi:DeoR family fructose operon transcriptional repressor
MRKSDRIQKILDVVLTEGNATVDYLADILGVSKVTIRRDLQTLCSNSDYPIKKVRGGVMYAIEKLGFEPMFEIKLRNMTDAKKKIAEIAFHLISDGDTVFLDSGTTIYFLAKMLAGRKGLKVLTVDVKVAEELAKHSNVKTIIACGEVRPGYYSICGTETIRFLHSFRADKAFISTDAWNLNGIFNSSTFEVEVKRTLIELAEKRYLLADHTKFGKNAFVKISDIDVFHAIITDSPPSENVLQSLENLGIKVLFPNGKDQTVNQSDEAHHSVG